MAMGESQMQHQTQHPVEEDTSAAANRTAREEHGRETNRHDSVDGVLELTARIELLELLLRPREVDGAVLVSAFYPGMIEGLLHCQAGFGIDREQPLDHVDGGLRHVIPVRRREAVVPALDLIVKCGTVFVVEGWKSADENVQDNSQAPQVNFTSVAAFLCQNFRRNVPRGTARRRHRVVFLACTQRTVITNSFLC